MSDEDRLKMILLIKTFGMSCHKAAKVLNIPYNNAKVIYRIYTKENRIKQIPKEQKRLKKISKDHLKRQKDLQCLARVKRLICEEESDTEQEDAFCQVLGSKEPASDDIDTVLSKDLQEIAPHRIFQNYQKTELSPID